MRTLSRSGASACNRDGIAAMYPAGDAVQFNNIFFRYLLVVTGLFLLSGPHAFGDETAGTRRVALVIGNRRYEPSVGPLRNSVRDAVAMAKALRSIGFTVIEKHDVTRDELLAALLQFRGKLAGAQVGLFYFAGHGISVAGANYLLPVKSGYSPEAPSATDRRLLAETKLFNAEQAVADMSSAGAGCNLIILDACRSTPVARDPLSRAGTPGGGLVEMNPPAGSLVAFATDAGMAANDGSWANGLYTEELIKNLLFPGINIEQVFKRTRAGVMDRSGGAQIPAEYSRLVGEDIYLVGPPISKTTSAALPKAGAPAELTLPGIQKLAAAGDATACVESLRQYTVANGIDAHADGPLATLLDLVKESLRNPLTARQNAASALETCDLVLEALADCVTADHPQRIVLMAKAYNRRGDAQLLLAHPEDALDSFDSAKNLDPNDGFILYNRGCALLALDQKEEARVQFTAVTEAKFKRSEASRLAKKALLEMR